MNDDRTPASRAPRFDDSSPFRFATPSTPDQRAGLFVDFENLVLGLHQAGYSDPRDRALELLTKLRERFEAEGVSVLLGRAYADWDVPGLEEASHALHLAGFFPQYVHRARGKNSADLELSLAALEVLLTREDVGVFALVGGDRDYIPVARRIRERGRRVCVVGARGSTSGDLVNAVGSANFLDAEAILGPAPSAVGERAAAAAGARGRSAGGVEAAPREWLPPGAPDEDRCLALLLKKEMAEAFAERDHEGRKTLLNSLAARGWIRFETRLDPLRQINYTVMRVERLHPEVERLVRLRADVVEAAGPPPAGAQ
jgi:hypothetical protein